MRRVPILALGGLTGIPTALLAPCFWLTWLGVRSGARLARAVTVSAAAVVQGFLVTSHSVASRAHGIVPADLVVGIAAKLVVDPLLGRGLGDPVAARLRSLVDSGGGPGWLVAASIAAAPAAVAMVYASRRAWRSGRSRTDG